VAGSTPSNLIVAMTAEKLETRVIIQSLSRF